MEGTHSSTCHRTRRSRGRAVSGAPLSSTLCMITTEAPVFPQSVIEQLDYYVYFLRDPSNKEIFYVGKGKGNRVFEHAACALADVTESDKLDRIRAIERSGKAVEHFVLLTCPRL